MTSLGFSRLEKRIFAQNQYIIDDNLICRLILKLENPYTFHESRITFNKLESLIYSIMESILIDIKMMTHFLKREGWI